MGTQSSEPCCKVTRVAAEYHIPDIDERLLRRRDRGESLREIAAYFNKQVLSQALDSATQEIVGDADQIYNALTGESSTRSKKVELRSKLDRNGVDIQAVESHFISHQTVRNHLHDCLEIDTGRQSHVDIDGGRKTIEWAQARSEGVIEQTLERLRSAEEITDVPTEVTQSVRVGCRACGQTYPIEEFLENRGCDCQQ
ncbi:rod-determining factor RdfA [Halorubrum sp. FL23]|uniref:rod-determining factor RdfA n=1 Tax=Halorubrum sp. FL23 TaxID=3458704 RepID=UPI004034B8C6